MFFSRQEPIAAGCLLEENVPAVPPPGAAQPGEPRTENDQAMTQMKGAVTASSESVALPVRVLGAVEREQSTVSYLACRVAEHVDLFVTRAVPRGARRSPGQVWLLHGAGMDSLGFDIPIPGYSLVERLAALGHEVLACDFRGHGRSSRVPDGTAVSAEVVRDDVVRAIELITAWRAGQAGPDPQTEDVHLFGESFGSIVTPTVAKALGPRVRSMTLAGSIFASLGTSAASESFRSFVIEELAAAPCGYAYTTEEEWPELFISNAAPEVIRWHQIAYGTAYMYPVGPYLSAAALPIDAELSAVTCATRVVIGELDPFATRPDMEYLFSRLGTTDTELVVQDGIGHLPYVEKDAPQFLDVVDSVITATASGA